MSQSSFVQRLYAAFDAQIERPTVFRNLGCCVSRSLERDLLSTPRHEVTAGLLAPALWHYPGCFGAFSQIAHFVPRIVELMAENERGQAFPMDVFGMLRAERGRYEEDGLWNPLLSAMRSLLQHRTSTFSLTHYDAAQCRAKGWGLSYADISNGEEVRALLTDWFAPELRDQPDSWESFWTQWADDVDSHRTCHLLDAVKHQLTGENEMGILPNSFMQRLADAGFVESLLVRARPLAGPRSPTWEEDVRHACARRQ